MHRPAPLALVATFCLAASQRAYAQAPPTPPKPADSAAPATAPVTGAPSAPSPSVANGTADPVEATNPADPTAKPTPPAAKPKMGPPRPVHPSAPAPAPIPDEELEVPLVPAAADELTGHLALAVGGGLAVPFGKLHADLAQDERVASGPAVSGSLSYGVSRTVALGLGGDSFWLDGSSGCTSCSATSFSVGPLVSYHLVQGTRFDPWLAVGVRYRSTTLDNGPSKQRFAGVEWFHTEFGGDWYALPNLAIGAFLEFNAGVYGTRPAATDSGTYWHMLSGLRFVLQVPGKHGNN